MNCAAAMLVVCAMGVAMNDLSAELRKAITFYASFDEEVRGDFGGGALTPSTRRDDPQEQGKFIFEKGIDGGIFRIAKDKGLRGGALEVVDVLPQRGRIFFPARGNLAYKPGGWGGAVSFWVSMNPNTMLKTPFCDPIQITHKGASDGGIWTDFPDSKPRDFRLGVFPAVPEGEKPIPESDPDAPLVIVNEIGFKQGEWHHVVMNWQNFDTGKPNATATLYIDGKSMGALDNRALAMQWDLDRAGIYVAVNYIGLLDELLIFNRPLTPAEVDFLRTHVADFSPAGDTPSKEESRDAQEQLRVLEQHAARLADVNDGGQRRRAMQAEVVALLRSDVGADVLEPALHLAWQLSPEDGAPAPPKFPFSAAAAREYQRKYAAWSGLPMEIANRAGMTLVLCPPGDFLMGSPDDEPGHGESEYEETQHPVRLTQPFYLSQCETTVGQFRRFVAATKYITDGERNGGGHAHDELAVWEHRGGVSWLKPGYAGPFELRDEHPVVHVSHSDAVAFCDWLPGELSPAASASYTLPTEAQWEWACRAGSGERYWWGDETDGAERRFNAGDVALKRVHPRWPRATLPGDDSFAFAAPVGSFEANAFGLCDMLGNVWEFCSTRYGKFPGELAIDPGDLSEDRGYAVRGGGWSNIVRDVRCAARNADPPHFCHSNLGFRVSLQLVHNE